MRIISGKMRGLKLNSPKDDSVRPTTDRVKESLFNVISPYVYDANVLDLFAGSGALGIECLSRGATKCTFVDNSRDSITIIKSNISKAKFEDSSEVLNMDYKEVIKKMSIKSEKFDIIFLDPPYYKDMFEEAIQKISESDILNEEGIIIVEHDYKLKIKGQIGKLYKHKIN